MDEQTNKKKSALFIDTANCRNVDLEQALHLANEQGDVVLAQAYGNYANWRHLGEAAEKLFLLGVRLIHCPGWRNGATGWKDAADEVLMNDIRTIAQAGEDLTQFIICSGDGHYIPTICELKRQGKDVIVMATSQAASRLVVEAATRFVPLPSAA